MTGIEHITFTAHYDADFQRRTITVDRWPDRIAVDVALLWSQQLASDERRAIAIDHGHIKIGCDNGRADYVIVGVHDTHALVCQRVESELRE